LMGLAEHTFVLTTSGDPAAGPVLFNLDSDTWHVGPKPPCEPADPAYSQDAWAGSVLVVPCGTTRLAIFDPATGSWTTIDAGPSPLNSRADSAVVWTGSQLVAWSGSIRHAGNPTVASGAAIDLSGFTSG